VDAQFAGSCVKGVALYFTGRPNTFVDIGAGAAAKHAAIDCYVSQLDADTRRLMHAGLERKESAWGERAGCERAEALRVLHPAHLHCNPDAEEMEG
jgi:LmbE family N-acetylglucosaminyl deacetylase